MSRLTASQRLKALPLGTAALVTGQSKLAFNCFAAAATGHWEGHESNRYRHRPSTRLESQDEGLKYGLRDKFISEARRLDQTFSIVGKIKESFSQYTVGDCGIEWNTGDPKIDALYEENWRNAMNTLDANGQLHFVQMTDLVVKATLGDGDIGAQKVGRFDSRGVPTGPGQLRLIEADRIRTQPSVVDCDDKDVIGGIGLTPNGARKFYRVWDRGDYGLFENKRELPPSEFIHVYNPERVDGQRGVTAFKRVINTLADLKETVRAEVLSAKRNSKLALLIKTVMGGAQPNYVNLLRGEDGTTGTDSGEGNKVNVQEINNAVDAYMFPNEDMKAHESNRPSEGWQYLMEWMMQDIAAGLYLPVAVVWKMSGSSTGPIARLEISQANRTFQKFRFQVVELMWIRKVAGWITARDIARGVIPFHPNWANFMPRRPASITIDAGRDTRAGIDEVDAGLGGIADWYDESGKTAKETIDKNIKLLKYMKEEAEKAKLEFSDVRRPAQAAATLQTAQQSAQAQPAQP